MKKKKEVNNSIKILRYFNTAKLSIVVIVITMILSCVFGVITPVVTANILTHITAFSPDKALMFSLILLVVIILQRINDYICNVVYLKGFKKKVLLNLRKDMIKNIFSMKTINFDNHTSGEFAERLRNDPENISMILSAVQYSFFNLITDVLVLIYIFYINYIIGIVYCLGIVIVFLYEKYAFEKQKQLTEKTKELNEKNSTILNETMHGIRDIKLLNMINSISNLINKSLDISNDAQIEKNVKKGVIYDVVNVIKGIIEIVVLIVGIALIKYNYLTVTNLIIIYMYRINMFDIVLCYTTIKEYFVEYKVSANRIFELMDEEKYPKEKFGSKKIEQINGKIECRNLSFKYSKKDILKDISFKLEPNDTVGIVGSSGSGKTTLLNLLVKSYYVDDNQIFIDDIDINNLTRDSIRNNISIITQNPYIFNLTIEENLKLVGDNVKKKDIIEACKIAQIHDYIESLPNKYNTLLGEGGINLSGGQRQRLAIARALIKKSKIILFDEATSALDNITQNELRKAINNITKNYTIIIVAHRLSTIKDCNKIFVMENGRIVGEGTNDELLKNNEFYKKLYMEEQIEIV